MASVTWEHLYQWHIVCVCMFVLQDSHCNNSLSFLQVSDVFTVLSEIDCCVHACVCVCTLVCAWACMLAHVHLCVHAFVCVHMYACICVYVY